MIHRKNRCKYGESKSRVVDGDEEICPIACQNDWIPFQFPKGKDSQLLSFIFLSCSIMRGIFSHFIKTLTFLSNLNIKQLGRQNIIQLIQVLIF